MHTPQQTKKKKEKKKKKTHTHTQRHPNIEMGQTFEHHAVRRAQNALGGVRVAWVAEEHADGVVVAREVGKVGPEAPPKQRTPEPGPAAVFARVAHGHGAVQARLRPTGGQAEAHVVAAPEQRHLLKVQQLFGAQAAEVRLPVAAGALLGRFVFWAGRKTFQEVSNLFFGGLD